MIGGRWLSDALGPASTNLSPARSRPLDAGVDLHDDDSSSSWPQIVASGRLEWAEAVEAQSRWQRWEPRIQTVAWLTMFAAGTILSLLAGTGKTATFQSLTGPVFLAFVSLILLILHIRSRREVRRRFDEQQERFHYRLTPERIRAQGGGQAFDFPWTELQRCRRGRLTWVFEMPGGAWLTLPVRLLAKPERRWLDEWLEQAGVPQA